MSFKHLHALEFMHFRKDFPVTIKSGEIQGPEGAVGQLCLGDSGSARLEVLAHCLGVDEPSFFLASCRGLGQMGKLRPRKAHPGSHGYDSQRGPQPRCLATQTRAPSQLLGACPDESPSPSCGGGGGAPESSTWEPRST